MTILKQCRMSVHSNEIKVIELIPDDAGYYPKDNHQYAAQHSCVECGL